MDENKSIWTDAVTKWYEFSIGKILWLGDQTNQYLYNHDLKWIQRFHALAFHLSATHSLFDKCKIGGTVSRINAITLGNKEYRIRSGIVYTREIKS